MDHANNFSRRSFLGMVAGTGLVAGCGPRAPRYLVPYAVPPDDTVPGIARFYRTVCRECPAACGVEARVREGRVVKLEGNPEHPISRGALCLRGQAAIEGLYSPERQTTPLLAGTGGLRAATWSQAMAAFTAGLRAATAAHRRVVILTRPEMGALGSLMRDWLVALGQSADQVVTFDPMEPTWIRDGARRAFGIDRHPVVDIAGANMLLSIGADILEDWGSPVEHARQLAEMREAGGKFVYVGPRLSLTAGIADEWLSVRPGQEMALVLGLVQRALAAKGDAVAALDPGLRERLGTTLAAYDAPRVAARTGLTSRRFERLADALLAARPGVCIGPGRVAAGSDAVMLAEAVHVLNALLGDVGQPVRFLQPAQPATAPWAGPGMAADELIRATQAGEVGALVVHHANPVGFGPALAPLTEAVGRIPLVVAVTNRLDETARRAHVVLPDHHFLETWSDVSPRPGVRGIQQAVMMPVHTSTRAAADILLDAARTLEAPGLDDRTFDAQFRQDLPAADVERGGVFADATTESATLLGTALDDLPEASAPPAGPGTLTLVAVPSVRHLDGLRPDNPLVQEIPDPLTTIAWGGWVEIHPAVARQVGATIGDLVRVSTGSSAVELPVFVHPGVREDVVAVPVPYVASLRTAGSARVGRLGSVRIEPLGREVHLPILGGSVEQHERELLREVGPGDSLEPEPVALSMYAPVKHPHRRWAMAIDLERCTGCSACVAACYVENNCPVVGAEEVARGRDMSWLHVKRFIEGPPSQPQVAFLPSMCQQCSNAPCESVCPVYATYHTQEGLNAQVYNRCVGTRYCENNCPYGARRFNWFDWPRPLPSDMGLNPDVSIRERGITEKCTFCVQRIRAAEEQARVEGRPLVDGGITPACAQTCPSHAIAFGDLKEPDSAVARLAASGRAYRLLPELNAGPGVVYLARRRRETPA